jgi:hypothetical protein
VSIVFQQFSRTKQLFRKSSVQLQKVLTEDGMWIFITVTVVEVTRSSYVPSDTYVNIMQLEGIN